MNYDEYLELYHTENDWYLNYVDKELKKIQRRYKHEKTNPCQIISKI